MSTIEELEEIIEELVSEVKELQEGLSFAEKELDRLEGEVRKTQSGTSAVRELQYELQKMFPKLYLTRDNI